LLSKPEIERGLTKPHHDGDGHENLVCMSVPPRWSVSKRVISNNMQKPDRCRGENRGRGGSACEPRAPSVVGPCARRISHGSRAPIDHAYGTHHHNQFLNVVENHYHLLNFRFPLQAVAMFTLVQKTSQVLLHMGVAFAVTYG